MVKTPRPANILLTAAEAAEMIGCTSRQIHEWCHEGRLWAIDISTESARRVCYRIGRASALAVRRACRKGAVRKSTS